MRYFYIIIFSILSLSVYGQNRLADSLTHAIPGLRDDTVKVNALNELSNQYLWIDFYRALNYAEESLRLAKKISFAKGIATASNLKGFCHWAFGDNELAIEMGLNSMEIAKSEKSPTILAESYLILARAYMDQNEFGKANDYLARSEKIGVQAGNWDQLSRVYNLAGVVQFLENKEDSALQLYTKALVLAQDHLLEKINLPRILSNLGECYLTNDPTRAFNYFNQGLTLARETGNKTAEASISAIMGRALLKQNKLSQAETYLQSALEVSRKIGLRRAIRSAYAGMVDLRLQQGRAEEAVEYLKTYYKVRDSLLNNSKTRQIVELEARYELQKKEQAIKLLEQEKRIQKIWKNILFVSVILLAILSVAIYYFQKYRESKNRAILNLEIDYLSQRHREISEKYKNTVLAGLDRATGSEKIIESHDQRLLKQAIRIVEENMADPLFGVEKMAKEMGMSRTNMNRKLKAITGFPPSELIRSIRLRNAANLLLNQVDSISQISIRVGFEDHSYFSKSFKKQFGVSPSEYVQSSVREEILN